MKGGTRRIPRVVLLVVVSCSATSLATRWFVLADARIECGEAVVFDRYEEALAEFVRAHELSDGEVLFGYELPRSLARVGIIGVSRKSRFIFFRLAPTGFLPDDGKRDFVYTVDRDGRAVEELMTRATGNTYHIQYLRAPGWYYWEHN